MAQGLSGAIPPPASMFTGLRSKTGVSITSFVRDLFQCLFEGPSSIHRCIRCLHCPGAGQFWAAISCSACRENTSSRASLCSHSIALLVHWTRSLRRHGKSDFTQLTPANTKIVTVVLPTVTCLYHHSIPSLESVTLSSHSIHIRASIPCSIDESYFPAKGEVLQCAALWIGTCCRRSAVHGTCR